MDKLIKNDMSVPFNKVTVWVDPLDATQEYKGKISIIDKLASQHLVNNCFAFGSFTCNVFAVSLHIKQCFKVRFH